jgi:hypothetical protein
VPLWCNKACYFGCGVAFCAAWKIVFCAYAKLADRREQYDATTKRTKATKDPEIIYISISSFVLFVTFVVKYLFLLLVAFCHLRFV